jgi:hypothetical protein
MSETVREFLTRKQRDLYSDQTCRIRISDLDGYEHLSFTLRKNTDLHRFNNVFDQDMLDAAVNTWDECHDEEGHTFFITADIEL